MNKSALKSAAEFQMFTALEEVGFTKPTVLSIIVLSFMYVIQCCNRSEEYFLGTVSSITPTFNTFLSPMDQLAHKCVSVQFLLEIYEQVVQPYRPNMTVKEVVDEIIIPSTKEKQCSFIDQLRPKMYVTPHVFISHAFGNPFRIIVEYLKSYFRDAVYAEVYVWIDIFIINQHTPGDDLHNGLTLKTTIQASGSVVVCLDKDTLPLSRLWCLYEIGSTPIEKLVLLTDGFDAAELGLAYTKIDATTADCFSQSDKEEIRGHIRNMMVEQKIVDRGATVEEALTAFTRVLKLLLILKPTSYSADMAAVLDRAAGYENYPLKETVGQACTGGRLIVIAGGSGEGKSTLAAALWTAIDIHACHFCKLADIRRQDIGLVVRSLSYQLAIRFSAFAQALLTMTPSQVESLSDERTAFELLLEIPLRAARGLQATILIDALDESGRDGRIISLLANLDNIQREVEGSSINIIATTRPEPAILSPLRSHWRGEKYIEFIPAELRGEVQFGIDQRSPLLRTLIRIIRQKQPYIQNIVPDNIYHSYEIIFNRGEMEQHRVVLEVLLASYEPQSLSDLKSMGLLQMARRLPGYGELFLERENKLHLLHRSVAEWLLDPEHGAVDIQSGHATLAKHIWEMVLRPWLLPSTSSSSPGSFSSLQPWLLASVCISPPSSTSNIDTDNSREPVSGSYSLKYALAHLRESGRYGNIKQILFRLPWLQAVLKEKGLGGLVKDLISITGNPSLAAATNKLAAVLRLSSSALLGNDALKCLPAQLLGRIRENEEDSLLQSLRKESNLVSVGNWLKPLKSSLQTPGNLEMTMIGSKEKVSSVISLPDGRLVSCSEEKVLRVWNMTTGDCELILSGHDGRVNSVVALRDGRIVSCSDDKTLRIWNVTSRECEVVLSGHEGWVNSVIALPDSRIVSCSNDRTLRIWNTTTGVCEIVLTGHKGWVRSVIALPDGRLVSCSDDKKLRIWNCMTGDCEIVLTGHEKGVRSVIALPNGSLVSCSGDKISRIWNSITGACKRVLKGHMDRVNSVISLIDGRIVSCSKDKTLRIWNVKSGNCQHVLYGHEDSVNSVIALRNGHLVSCSDDKTLRVWNSTTCSCETVLVGHQGAVNAVIGLPDGRIASCSDDKTLRVWNVTPFDVRNMPSGHTDKVNSVIVLPDDRIVSCSNDETVRVWNTTTGECDRLFSGHKGVVNAVIVAPDNRLVSSSDDGSLRVWNMTTGECDKVLSGYVNEWMSSIFALPDGRIVSFHFDDFNTILRVWSITNGRFEHEFHAENQFFSCSYDGVNEARLLSDGRLLSRDVCDNCFVWSATGEGFQNEFISLEQYSSLSRNVGSDEVGIVKRGRAAPGYSLSGNWVLSESFGRVFVDGPVEWMLKVGNVIAVFQKDGRDHWFREVSN